MRKRSPRFAIQLQNAVEPQIVTEHLDFTGLSATILLIVTLTLAFITTSVHEHILRQFGITWTDCDTIFYIAFGLASVFYLIYSFATDTIAYLWHLDHVEGVIRYVERIKAMPATLEFSCDCYHFETRIRYVAKTRTEHITVNGKTISVTRTWNEPETYQERINTHSETRNFVYSLCKDTSPALTNAMRQYQAVRVNCEYHISFGDNSTRTNYEVSKARFIAENRSRDVNFDFRENHYIIGFKPQLLSVVDIAKKPFLMHWIAYIISILMLLSWPYRLWFYTKTVKGHLEFRKHIFS